MFGVLTVLDCSVVVVEVWCCSLAKPLPVLEWLKQYHSIIYISLRPRNFDDIQLMCVVSVI